MKKRIFLSAIALIAALVLVLTGCDTGHTCADGDFDNLCDVCGKAVTIECRHSYANDCDGECDLCHETRTPSAHKYDNGCDTACNVCEATRQTQHVYDSDCDAICNECSYIRSVQHTYDNACDGECNVCHKTRSTSHTYDNACDGECNVCRETRSASHTYDNACDGECNVCRETRSTSHTYDNACDGECNVCRETRSVPHAYDNDCDTTCNLCPNTRVTEHKYNNECDAVCKSCGAVRTTSHKDDNSDGKCDYCTGDMLEHPALTRPALSVPAYSGQLYIELNGDVPYFTANQYTTTSYEYYSARDSFGRCGIAVASIGKDLMPTSSRGSISSVTPSGWHASSIYERAHLIAFSLTGENANWENLITGTYDLNGVMQTYEEMVVSYIKETNNHVLYRVTPLFEGDNLLATGVNIEAWSVEDSGAGICFNIFIYNVETDYIIDYKTGAAQLDPNSELMKCTFVINKSKNKFHLPTCKSVTDMSDANKIFSYKTFEELIAEGYSKCGTCLKNYGN